MAKESFEDEEVANLLNKRFVPIKVDREERPDIDMFYITACEAATGSAGWPLTAICTPEGKPFFLGTYFPPRAKHGRVGLIDILTTISQHWKRNRTAAEAAAKDLMDAVQRLSHPQSTQFEPGQRPLQRAVEVLRALYDEECGGFGGAPKFPTPSNLLFLLREWHASQDEQIKEMVETTLVSMYRGGIFDHIGGGFHRYATDRRWLVPHFEKTLYDNALLAFTYLEAFQAFGRPLYRTVAERTLTYVLRDMQHPDGGFYAAEDADSEGVEGKFYLWRRAEILAALPSPTGEDFCTLYGITEDGNFAGENIPNLLGASEDAVQNTAKMEPWLNYLQRQRTFRVRPACDDKILTGWNGLMIAALARGARFLSDEQFLKAARAAVAFIMDNLVDGEGRLFASFRKRRGVHAFLDDYAFLCFGLLELYEASQTEQYLNLAARFMADVLDQFADPHGPGLFFTSCESEHLPLRPKSFTEGALPSGLAVTMWNLAKLDRLLPHARWADFLAKLTADAHRIVHAEPWHYPALLMGLELAETDLLEITFAGDLESSQFGHLWAAVNSHYLPAAVIKFEPTPRTGQCVAQVCCEGRCLAPVQDPEELLETLARKKASV